MKMIIDTDIGRDPDDFFALLWFISSGVDIKLVNISPGDADQVAVCHLIRDQLDLDFPIGVGKLDRNKRSSGSIHYKMLKKYGYPLEHTHDGDGAELMKEARDKDPDCHLFICGPPISTGNYLKEYYPYSNSTIPKATMQGGFLSYNLHGKHKVPVLDKFRDKITVPTFNMNGDVKGTIEFVNALIGDRRFVGKNVCHTILYNQDVHEQVAPTLKVRDRAGELFVEAMDMYLAKHSEKKFHDPAAAVSHFHPEIFGWVEGRPYRRDGGWGTDPMGMDKVAANVDYNKLWQKIGFCDANY